MTSYIQAEAATMCEEYEFDKFMDDTLLKEGKKAARQKKEEQVTPGMLYARRYSETPNNRIKYTR